MAFNSFRKKFFLVIVCFTIVIFLSCLLPSLSIADSSTENAIQLSYEETFTELWFENPSFDIPIDPWYSQIEGDHSDVNATSNLGQANFEILGNENTFQLIDDPLNNNSWLMQENPDFPDFPDTVEFINGQGFHASHLWDEKADQAPSVHLERNITMPVDMSDYIITSVSLSTVVNATVSANNGIWGGIEVPGDPVTDAATYDYVRFYVLFSDLTGNKVYEVAFNQSTDLGNDTAGATDDMFDTFLHNKPQNKLIEYLTSVLNTDNRNFTITLGIRIWCEDNLDWDEDQWDDLWIKSFNLTFTYVKKINRFTSISWNQEGNDISGNNTQIVSAHLNFKYKIDQNWTVSSPNSEIRILVNNNSYSEVVKLTDYIFSSNFQEAKSGGYNVTSLILKDTNITLSIQLFLADDFGLDREIKVSITDVYFYITYVISYTDPIIDPWIASGLFIIVTIGAIVLGGYLIAYQKYLKYPIPVRKVRKYRKTLTSEKEPDIRIINRKYAFNKSFQGELNKTTGFLKGGPLDGKIVRDKLLGKQQEIPIQK